MHNGEQELYPGMCTTVGMYPAGYCTPVGMYPAGYGSRREVYPAGYGSRSGVPGIYTPGVLEAILPPEIYLPTHPGYTSSMPVHLAHACRYPVVGYVQDDEALGSS